MEELSNAERSINFILKDIKNGFRVDAHTLADLKKSYESDLLNLKKELRSKLGKAVRIDSNRELSDMLFRDLSLTSLRNTPTGKPCVSVEVLERLCDLYADTHAILKSVIEFKNAQSLIKAVKIILKKLDLQGRIHPEFNYSTCPTGRIYSYVQNLPKDIRDVLIPDEEGNIFIELDWSQEEMIILDALKVYVSVFKRSNYLISFEIQGRRPMPSNWSKCLSKAKAFFSLRALMIEKLVQSVKLKSLSVYCLKIVKAASSMAGVTVTISMKPLFLRLSRKRTAISCVILALR